MDSLEEAVAPSSRLQRTSRDRQLAPDSCQQDQGASPLCAQLRVELEFALTLANVARVLGANGDMVPRNDAAPTSTGDVRRSMPRRDNVPDTGGPKQLTAYRRDATSDPVVSGTRNHEALNSEYTLALSSLTMSGIGTVPAAGYGAF